MADAEHVKYSASGVELVGRLLRAKTDKGKHALVLWLPNFVGVKAFDVKRCAAAREALDANYFVVDVYGEAAFPVEAREDSSKHGDKPMSCMNANLIDPVMHRAKLRAAYDAAKKATGATHVACIGFCYGGTCALEMLRDGLELKAAISLHSTLDGLPVTGGGPAIKRVSEAPNKHTPGAHVLVGTGLNDPLVPDAVLRGLEAELKAATALGSYSVLAFGNCGHAFTDSAKLPPTPIGGFQPTAARTSWNASVDLLRTALELPAAPLDPQLWVKLNDP